MLKQLVLLCVLVALGAADPTKLTSPAGVKYTYLSDLSTRGDAPGRCAALGLALSNIANDSEIDYIGKSISNTVWIDKWQNNDFNGACIAAFQGGAIAVPINNCNAQLAVLCDGQH